MELKIIINDDSIDKKFVLTTSEGVLEVKVSQDISEMIQRAYNAGISNEPFTIERS